MDKSKVPDPASYAKNGSEHGHQVAIFCWCSQHFDKYPELRLLFAIPNGGERNKIVAANLKAEGVKSAIPDMLLPVARGEWHGLFIELKRPDSPGKPKGRVDSEQVDMHVKLREQGYGVCVAWGWQEAIKLIEAYLNWK